jgi:Raf kinase inhibitor-like YbhB/YbcL family protein
MMRSARILSAILAFALPQAACSSAGPPADGGGLKLSIPGFSPGTPVPRDNTCDGADRSPALEWSGVPAGTRSFALVVNDPDAPGGTFAHWGAYNIPVSVHYLAEGAGAVGADFAQARNDFDSPSYNGPCPPRHGGAHRYRFTLYALNLPQLYPGAHPLVLDLEKAIEGRVIAKAEVVASYARD